MFTTKMIRFYFKKKQSEFVKKKWKFGKLLLDSMSKTIPRHEDRMLNIFSEKMHKDGVNSSSGCQSTN